MSKNIYNLFSTIMDKIVAKRFSIEPQGYNASEVDLFLDELNNDFELAKNILINQQNLITNLKNELNLLNKQYVKLMDQRNYENKLLNDLLEKNAGRLSVLERINKIEDKLDIKK